MHAGAQRSILVGVHVGSPLQDVEATLHALFENTAQPFTVRLLPDPADEQEAQALQRALDAFPGVPQRPGAPGQGPAACFNRLIAESADIFVFLEGGARPAPGWLDTLLAALDAEPSNGLAGPSTNRGWNEQALAPHCATSLVALWEQADTLAARYGTEWATLEPLHSLADFCYVVKNEVVAAVGRADEAYGQGPCWEMDYSVRAARAGFRGAWAKGAYVHRAPPQRAEAQALLLEDSKRLYQDRFCALRAEESQAADYHAHCAGDDCRHFALPERTRIHLPLPAHPALPLRVVQTDRPLVSCIMPTRGRPEFVAQSIRYFQRQDWPHRELVVVHEDEHDLPARIDDPRVRCVRVPAGTSIGAKRNEAVRLAHGEVIAHWDDDDWYGDERLSRQLAPLLHNLADVSGLSAMLLMAIQHGEFWAASRALFRRLFVENVSGGTLVFWRSLWQQHGHYPATSLREDADFLVKIMRGGARLCRVPGQELCIYVRHQGNTWKFREGRYLQESEWTRVAPPDCVGRDMDFYFPELAPPPEQAEPPLVSCIMPTADRRAFVAQAIRDFLEQDYPRRELVVVDDGNDSVADLIPSRDDIRYVRLNGRSSIGAKRNIACELARGEVVVHWDDDDWHAPAWLRSQVDALLAADADICGLDKVYFYRPDARQAWQYVWDGDAHWVYGGTLCYRRDFWRAAPFPDVNTGEDNAFVWKARPERVAVNPQHHLYVARVHAGNTSPKATNGRRWHQQPVEQVERLLLEQCHAA